MVVIQYNSSFLSANSTGTVTELAQDDKINTKNKKRLNGRTKLNTYANLNTFSYPESVFKEYAAIAENVPKSAHVICSTQPKDLVFRCQRNNT